MVVPGHTAISSHLRSTFIENTELLDSTDVMNSAVLANDTNEYINDEVVMETSTLSEVIDEDDTMVDHKRNVALFILKPRVMYKIPQVYLESLLADLSEIIENKVCEATEKLNDPSS